MIIVTADIIKTLIVYTKKDIRKTIYAAKDIF